MSFKNKQSHKIFSSAVNSRIHGRVHTGEKPHECKEYGKCFSIARNLRTHERVHLNVNSVTSVLVEKHN